ncbi:MAG: hypothetical protein JWM51_847, partial [Microbacteriaceae bacterium]|nr:hypothetical protein [Microbacteriaceae bacterium]
LIGTTGTSTIHRNTVTGKGPSAIDVARTEGAVVTDNDAEEWRSTKGALRAGLAIRLATRRVHLRIDDRCCPVMPPH